MIKNLNKKLSGELPVTRSELIILVDSWGRNQWIYDDDNIKITQCLPTNCYPLDKLDVSQISNMNNIFYGSNFVGDISNWNVSNVKNMEYMFFNTNFNGDLSKWNVENVITMESMFEFSQFNNNSLNTWNLKSIEKMESMFFSSNFNGDISKWKINENCVCDYIFSNNKNFKNKYNNFKNVPIFSNSFLKWFEENRMNIANLNVSNEELIDIDDYLISFNEIKEKELL